MLCVEATIYKMMLKIEVGKKGIKKGTWSAPQKKSAFGCDCF